MTEMKKLDTSKITSLKDVRAVFDLLDLSFNLPEDHKNYEILKDLTVEPEPCKSVEELQQELNEKLDELIEKTKRNYYASNLTAENNYNRQFDMIFNNLDYAVRNGKFPTKYGIITDTGTSGKILLNNEPGLNWTIQQSNPSKKWKCYLFGSKPGCYYMVYHPQENQVPNALVRWCSNVFLGCKWVKEK
jgi:hypothetical protein